MRMKGEKLAQLAGEMGHRNDDSCLDEKRSHPQGAAMVATGSEGSLLALNTT